MGYDKTTDEPGRLSHAHAAALSIHQQYSEAVFRIQHSVLEALMKHSSIQTSKHSLTQPLWFLVPKSNPYSSSTTYLPDTQRQVLYSPSRKKPMNGPTYLSTNSLYPS